MRRLLCASGFVLSLVVAAGSFASIMGDDGAGKQIAVEQTFLIPRSAVAGIGECLAEHGDCGQSAAASICEAKGFARVVTFGEATAEDMTGSVGQSARKVSPRQPKERPFLVTCAP